MGERGGGLTKEKVGVGGEREEATDAVCYVFGLL